MRVNGSLMELLSHQMSCGTGRSATATGLRFRKRRATARTSSADTMAPGLRLLPALRLQPALRRVADAQPEAAPDGSAEIQRHPGDFVLPLGDVVGHDPAHGRVTQSLERAQRS